MTFTQEEIDYLRTQRLARIATVSRTASQMRCPWDTSSMGRISTSAA